jgi:putative drug exporter of the RND superfamily
MSRLLAILGTSAARHPWRTLAAWLVVLAAAVVAAVTLGGAMHNVYELPGARSQAGIDLLEQRFPDYAGSSARVVVHDREGDRVPPAELTKLRTELLGLDAVTQVSAPQPSGDGDTAILTVQYDKPVTDLVEPVAALEDATAATRDAGLQVELGGEVPEDISVPSGTAEAIGVTAALVILLIAFGSIVAAGLPLLVAAFGLGVGLAGVTLMAAVTDVSTTTPTAATMIGIGLGIDYALFIATRFREELRAGRSVVAAAGRANATAGQSVVFAGFTVLLSICGLAFVGIPYFATMGFACAMVVAITVVASISLLPAFLGLAGHRVLGKKERAALAAGELVPVAAKQPWTARWASRVGRNPLPWGLAALVFLVTLAAPLLSMRTWPNDAGSQPDSNTVRRAYDVIAAEYGEGANGPLTVLVDLDKVPADDLPALRTRLSETVDVDQVSGPLLSPERDAAVFEVVPKTGPQDERSADLVHRLRDEVLPDGGEVIGLVAVQTDISDRIAERLWVIIGLVVATALVLLLFVFRSPVVAVKAAVMNLLSIGAAYGVLVAIFQWGWGISLFGLPHAVPVSSWVPILMFALLFGLSMDYEVFLLSRIRERFLATGDGRGSVVDGLAATGRVITSAALIMVAVFVGFALDTNLVIKMLGLGMAVAVAVDATIVRLILVPATMAILGRANWWLPKWLDRILPHVAPHGAEDDSSDATPPRHRVPVG